MRTGGWKQQKTLQPLLSEGRLSCPISTRPKLLGILDLFIAFILFKNSTVRTPLQHYRGLSTVVDSRVACVQPKIYLLMAGGGWYLNGDLILGDLPECPIMGDTPANTVESYMIITILIT